MSAQNVTIEERGNGLPDVGDYVPGDDGNLWRIVSLIGSIQTGRYAGASNWVRATAEMVGWDDCEEENQFAAMVIAPEAWDPERQAEWDGEQP